MDCLQLGAGGWWWAAVLRNVEHLAARSIQHLASIPVQIRAQHSTAQTHICLDSTLPGAGADYKLVHSLLPATTGQMSIMK